LSTGGSQVNVTVVSLPVAWRFRGADGEPRFGTRPLDSSPTEAGRPPRLEPSADHRLIRGPPSEPSSRARTRIHTARWARGVTDAASGGG
jgi:hypothetical protein